MFRFAALEIIQFLQLSELIYTHRKRTQNKLCSLNFCYAFFNTKVILRLLRTVWWRCWPPLGVKEPREKKHIPGILFSVLLGMNLTAVVPNGLRFSPVTRLSASMAERGSLYDPGAGSIVFSGVNLYNHMNIQNLVLNKNKNSQYQ